MSPQPPHTLSLSQVMHKNMILPYYTQIWKFSPWLPKMEFFKMFSLFLERSPDPYFASNEPSTQPPPDIKFKSSYARKCDYAQILISNFRSMESRIESNTINDY